MPRRALSPDADNRTGPTPGPGKGKDKKVSKKGGDESVVESPAPPTDMDEKLVFDGYMYAVNAITTMVSLFCC